MRWLVKQVKKHPRPANNVKIYGSGHTMWGSGRPQDGIERFFRDLIGGCASARFHRPGAGNGLNALAQAGIKAARKLESVIKMWDVDPQMGLLVDRRDEVYVAAGAGGQYALYFADSGSVGLDLSADRGRFKLRWISVESGEWGEETLVDGGSVVTLFTPGQGGWAAALVRV
jgi:hypothetical protein